MSKDPRGRLFHCPFQLYEKKDPEKTRRKVPNRNAVEVTVQFLFQRIHHCAKLIFFQRILIFILLVENPFSSTVC